MPLKHRIKMWHEMSLEEQRDFHSEGNVRARNLARRKARSHGNIKDSTQVNQGNDEIVFPSYGDGGGGGGLPGALGLNGIEIIWADQEETFISASDILENYDSDNDDYWSVVFAVSNNAFTQATPTYDSTQDLWDDTGTDQTVYRLRVKTLDGDNDPTSISMYGQYRESILCVNGDPVTVLVKIS